MGGGIYALINNAINSGNATGTMEEEIPSVEVHHGTFCSCINVYHSLEDVILA